MKVLIIEDEKTASDNLNKMLGKILDAVDVEKVLETVKASIDWLPQSEAELIFMDVHLADDISFKIFEAITINTPIIFTTAYDQYALRAFHLNSIDYLLKPIDKSDLERAILKYKNLTSKSNNDLSALIESYQINKDAFQKRFIVSSGDRIKSFTVDQIAYFYGQDKYAYLVTHKNQTFLIDQTLTHLEEVLDPEQFFRINRQLIISFSSIDNMFAYPRGRVKIDLKPKCKIESIVSIDRSGSFKNWLNR